MGSTARQRRVAKHPLRRVIWEIPWTFWVDDREYVATCREQLECGHVLRAKSDFYGETTAERRRCHKCANGSPPDMPEYPVFDEGSPERMP